MKIEYRIPLFVILGGAVVVAGVSAVPPLTSDGNGQSGDSAKAALYRATVSQELAYCREQGEDVNCRCFARTSGTILTHDAPKVSGAIYANKQELARGQAVKGC